MSNVKSVYVHKLVRIGKSAMGSQRYRVYTNLGSVNMSNDAKIGREFDKVNDLDNAPLVREWVQLTMRGTTFVDAKLV